MSNFFGDVILTVQNVTEIFGDFNSGHFVFTNDSTFYYIPQLKDKVYGPITIEGIQGGRRPIRKHLVDHEPIKRFILYLDNHSSGQKVLYIPDSAIVISNFDQIENDFISDLIENTEDIDKKEEKKSNRGLVFGLLIISLMINFVLLVKKNNKSS